jgi:hypothetical protein
MDGLDLDIGLWCNGAMGENLTSRRVGRASRPSFLFHQILQAMPARRSEPRLDRAKREGRLGRSLALPSRRTKVMQ